MNKIRIRFRDDMPLGELADILNCISELYRVFSFAYAYDDCKTISKGGSEWESLEDLYVLDTSTGSFIIDIAAKVGCEMMLRRLFVWLQASIDPYNQRKNELDIEETEQRINKMQIIDDIEIARAGVALIQDAIRLHDDMIRRKFPEEVAKKAFYSAVKCTGTIRYHQEQNNDIINLELLD